MFFSLKKDFRKEILAGKNRKNMNYKNKIISNDCFFTIL